MSESSDQARAGGHREARNRGRLEGYRVQAIDGPIGEVIASDNEPGRGYVIAASDRPLCRRGLSSRTVVLLAGLIERVDRQARVIAIGCTLAQIGDAPAFENDRYQDGAYLTELDVHYSSAGAFGQAVTG